jgi:hypothetical protein
LKFVAKVVCRSCFAQLEVSARGRHNALTLQLQIGKLHLRASIMQRPIVARRRVTET